MGAAVAGAVPVTANARQLLTGEASAPQPAGVVLSKSANINEQGTELSCYKYLNSSLLIFVTLNVD